jgi:predicted metal-dependent HD superfamily phosphohydrolase
MLIQERFIHWHTRMNAAGCPKKLFASIEKLYASPGRYYHTLNGHVAWCIEKLWQISLVTPVLHHDAIEFALIMHDAVMNFNEKDEERSAEEARKLCKLMGLSRNFTRRVTRLIVATKHHNGDDPTTALMLDIDLAILGESSEHYQWYEKAIAQEYSFVPREAFVKGRTAVLQRFLAQKTIFNTSLFRSTHEARAKENISQAITSLR